MPKNLKIVFKAKSFTNITPAVLTRIGIVQISRAEVSWKYVLAQKIEEMSNHHTWLRNPIVSKSIVPLYTQYLSLLFNANFKLIF